MAHGRIETTPEQQLAELRRAYERYAALADQLKDTTDPEIDAELSLARAQDALRIAHAYEKTIASTALRLESMHRTHMERWRLGSLAKMLGLMFAGALVLFAASLATLRPDLLRAMLPQTTKPAPVELPVAAPAPQPAVTPRAPATVQAPAPAARPAPDVSRKPASASEAKPAPQPRTPAPQAKAAQPAPAAPPETKAPAPQIKTPPAVQVIAPPAPATNAPAPESITAAPAPPPAPLLQSSPVRPLSPPVNVAPLPVAPLQTVEPPRLIPVLRTHLRPPYPPMALRSGEQGTTQMQVTISTAGVITACQVTGSSGSQLLDESACAFVQRNWRWLPPIQNGQPASATTKISVIWNLAGGR